MSRIGIGPSVVLAYWKEILLAICFAITLPGVHDRLVVTEGLGGQISFLSLLALLWGALLAGAYSRQAALRWTFALLFCLSAYFMWVFDRVTTQFMTYDAFINLVHETGFAGDAWTQNAAAFAGAAPAALILLLAIGWPPRPRRPLLNKWMAAATPWLAAAAFTGILFVRGGDGLPGLPPSFTPIAYSALAGYEHATRPDSIRLPVRLPHATKPLSRNIVLVIDESIAGQYLDINSARGVPTPLSGQWPGIGIHNYGLAASVTNCSAGSNVTLRFGGTRADYKRIIATQPSIWAYAHKAGMRTVFINNQAYGKIIHNFMTEAEAAEIDRFVRLGHLPADERDLAAARLLVRELADPRPKLIVINKMGAHFPIQDKYPANYLHYRPAMAPSAPDVFHTGKQIGFTGTSSEWVLYRNSYRNALSWSVGGFFDIVLRQANLTGTTLIYTSDHGQNLHEDGSSGLYTHCGPSAVPSEGIVPLVVIEGGQASGLDWRRDLQRNHNRSSHFMIFPTILELMGYDRAASQAAYGLPLDAPSIDSGDFNTLFNARLGRKPTWLPIAPALAIQPLATDGVQAALPSARTKS